MALVVADRVKETSTTAGTGTLTLAGAVDGFQSFAVIGNGNTTYYSIVDSTANTWEVGIGTYSSSGTTLARTTVLANSSGNTSPISFAANSKDVFATYPAGKAVYQDSNGRVAVSYNGASSTVGSLNVGGDASGVTEIGMIASFVGDSSTYAFTGLQNKNSGAAAYGSYSLYNNSGTVYCDFGMNSSNYSYASAGYPDNSLSLPNATFVEAGSGSDLVLGTRGSTPIHFLVNGSVNTADALTISTAGNVSTPNTLSGAQVVASNGLVVNSNTVAASYSIPSGSSAMSVGPITVASGQSVTVPSGSKWVVL
jgi:hypothetical protein